MALGRRCDSGCESWPDTEKYAKCPVCGEKTKRFSNLEPLTQKEANAREFELFYERWDAEHDPSRLEADAPDARGPFARVEDNRPARLVPASSASG
jgi:hypothetical protein